LGEGRGRRVGDRWGYGRDQDQALVKRIKEGQGRATLMVVPKRINIRIQVALK